MNPSLSIMSGMLNSFNSGAFQISCLRFLNTFVETASNYRERVHIQAELEDAGLDISHLKKLLSKVRDLQGRDKISSKVGKTDYLYSALQFGNQSDLLKEELNIWTKNYIDVNSLVTEKFLMQKSLDKAKTDLESLRQKYQELELKHRKMLTEFSATKAKCDCYRWVEGASSEASDHDSGKHSDTSLVNSSEECWAEIDKINKSFHKRQPTQSCENQQSQLSQHQNNQRNLNKNREQRTGGTPGVTLTPTATAETDSDKSSYSEKQEKELLDEDGTKKGVNIVIIESESNSSSLSKEDHDTYVERDTLQEEAVMVESQTIAINQNSPSHSRTESVGGGHSVTRVGSSYDETPLPPSPRPVSKYRNREKRRDNSEVRIVSQLTDEDVGGGNIIRQPRPPIRRRPRSKMIAERPKSAPPEKYESQMLFLYDRNRSNNVSLSRDFSDEEASESYLSKGCYDPGESNQGTLETVSAKSFGFIRPSQRLLEREHNKRVKRHKSFFNADGLFGKKNSLIRRAESFHQGAGTGSRNDYYLMNAKYSSKDARDARERAKSVDRLLSTGEDDAADNFDRPIMKSKSMEFLKAKILRKPSKLQKKSPRSEISKTFLGQSMFELHKTQNYSPATHSNSRLYPDWPFANSSVYPSREFSKQDVRHSQGSSKLCETTQNLPPPSGRSNRSVGSQNYDWRQDTPFWNYSRQKRNDNVMNWGLADDGPPKWVPPPPQPHVHRPEVVQSKPPRRQSRESLSPPGTPGAPGAPGHQMGYSRMFPGPSPGLPVNQAVNSMYLPPTSYYIPASTASSAMEDSMLEITELEDEPLAPETGRILEMPSGLY